MIPDTLVIDDIDVTCDNIEAAIAYIQNLDYAHPMAQALLDLEGELVLREYYASLAPQLEGEN